MDICWQILIVALSSWLVTSSYLRDSFRARLVGCAANVTGEVCYDRLGCYNFKGPWATVAGCIPFLPEDPSKINTRFFLSTRETGGDRIEINSRPTIRIPHPLFKPKRRTYIIIHGFRSHSDLPWVLDMEQALLEFEDANVISVDYKNGANSGSYAQVVANARVVGAELARLINYLVQVRKASTKKMYLIGHSLGAHVASYASNLVGGVAKITGLDPAQPPFEGAHQDLRLDASDATFVDIIHTNSVPLLPKVGFGIIAPIGDVDFYVNGGGDQPGCKDAVSNETFTEEERQIRIKHLLLQPLSDLPGGSSCSHSRAVLYYNEALNGKCILWGHKGRRSSHSRYFKQLQERCLPSTCTKIGLDTQYFPAKGVFQVETNPSPPFCIQEPTNNDVMDLYITKNYR